MGMQSRLLSLRKLDKLGNRQAAAPKSLPTLVFPHRCKDTRRSNMRRVVLLAVLALALPTAAMANTFDFGNAGSLGTTASLTGSATAGGTITLSSVLTSIDNNGVLT